MEVKKIPKKTVTLIEPKRSVLVDKEKYHQKRVAAYCRVSTDSEEQLTSYVNQKKFYTDMIARNTEWEFAGLYADEGISGTRADKRPEFNNMIKACLAGKIDYIITKSVSRFARNTVDCLDYVRLLRARGIGIFFEEQNIDTLKSDSELYLVIYAGFAQSESESISKNITWSYRKNFEDGKPIFMFKKLLGYKKGEDGEPVIVPEEAEIVERIYTMYLSGMTVDVISRQLQSEHIEIPGKKFSFGKNMVMNILKNEKYCGDCILQKTVTVDCISKTRKKNEGEAPMYIVENSHPAIISREMFNRAQEELSKRKARSPQSQKTAITASGKYSKYALTDVLICAECGSRYKRVTWTSLGQKRIVWRCVNRLDSGKKYCQHSPTLSEPALQEAIVRALNKFNDEDTSTYLTLMKATIGEAIGANGGSDEIDLLERRIDALNSRMLKMVSESVERGADMEENEDEFKTISEQIEQLNRRIEAIRKSEGSDEDRLERLSLIQATIDQREANRDTYDDAMNLKEAFRYQNKLQSFMDEAQGILDRDANVTKVENTYLRHKVMAEAEDETVLITPETEYYEQITDIAQFLLYLLNEKDKLFAAIRTAKDALDIDMDSEVSLNATRQSIARTFKRMNDLRNSEQTISNGGTGYRFNAEGNQISYRCDVKRVTTINYDRNVIRAELGKLNRLADETSTKIDLCLVTSKVGYEPPFDVNSSFAEAFEAYTENARA